MVDLDIQGNRLYAASLSSNRVDVFDLSQGSPRFVMALGTGEWSGSNTTTLTHPLGVAASDTHVFVADTHGEIAVYQQSDVVPEKHKKAEKFAILALPGSDSIYATPRMEVVGQRLFASLGNGDTYVYNLEGLSRSATPVPAVMRQTGAVQVVFQGTDGRLYAGMPGGGVDAYAVSRLPLTGDAVLPSPSESSFRTALAADPTQDSALGKVGDVWVAGGNLICIDSQGRIVLAPLCSAREYLSSETATAPQLQTAGRPTERFLQDGETFDTITTQRSFRMDRILSGALDSKALRLTAYTVAPVSDLQVEACLKGSENWFVLAKLDGLTALSQTLVDTPLVEGRTYPLVGKAGSASFRGLGGLARYPADLFNLRITSATDPLVKKVMGLKPTWTIRFGRYTPDDGAWAPITPVYAREWVIMITNYAYVMNSPEFRQVWFHHKEAMGHEFYGNAGPVEGAGGLFTPADYERQYAAFMSRSGLRLGVTTIGGGLGGGDVLGVDTWNFYCHYYASGMGIIGHEFGHGWGSHSSAFSNSGAGIQPMIQWLHQMLLRRKELPYMDDNLNAFYKTPREQLYNAIAENMRRSRPDSEVNPLERYFAEHPLPASTY